MKLADVLTSVIVAIEHDKTPRPPEYDKAIKAAKLVIDAVRVAVDAPIPARHGLIGEILDSIAALDVRGVERSMRRYTTSDDRRVVAAREGRAA